MHVISGEVQICTPLEADLCGVTKHDFDVVALAGMSGQVGALVKNRFGLEIDRETLSRHVRRSISRLLVGVEDPNDAAAVQ
ncbi:hypothetical protein [Roseateles sp.]|uniref:hypothetical protein n=1 Tax=Roseateles sp. TaxID=1971397 RepID=UPI003264DD67